MEVYMPRGRGYGRRRGRRSFSRGRRRTISRRRRAGPMRIGFRM